MANKEVSALTGASALDGTETLHLVQGGNSRKSTAADVARSTRGRDQVTMTATTSATWAIPDGVTWVKVISGQMTFSGTNNLVTLRLNKQSDGLNASFGSFQFVYSGGSTSDFYPGLTQVGGVRANDASASTAGFTMDIYHPRSTTIKTAGETRGWSKGDQANNNELQVWQFVAASAEDHDEIVFECDNNMSGTIEIEYG